MASIDVTVHGAGIFGLSVAWACACRGARVRVLDPRGPGSGASGGIVGALAPHVPENWNPKKAFQLESLLMAETWWHAVQHAGGQDPGYARTGRVQPVLAGGEALARARAEGALALWAPHATWQVTTTPGPFSCNSPTGLYIHDTLSARIHPKQACRALCAALHSKGVEITPKATVQGKQIWATGWEGLRAMSAEQNRNLGDGVKGQAALLRFEARGAAQLFVDALHVVPHADGTVAVGSTSERDFSDPTRTDAACDALVAKARHFVPALSDAPVIAKWAGVRPRAKSRAPLMGEWPGRPGQFVLNGGFKIGFGMAPKCAEVMADLVLEGQDAVPDAFRFSL